ncbi:phBC6A51 family helix-turn-helix protein [Cohnella sp.]|uniref:phBC6A51 family helix-turn-helix protein n=1 Tax=Cohnella sp. TaxID=1883426 RepID=UPI003568B28A
MSIKTLNADHMTAIQYLALPKSQRPTIEEIAAECRVSKSTLYAWMREPLFESALKSQMVRYAQDDLPELVSSIARMAIRDSSAAMAKLALQMHGMLSDKVELQTSITSADSGTTDVEALKARIMALQGRSHATEETPIS